MLLERGSTNFSTGGFSAHSNVSLASAGGETTAPTGAFAATKVTKTSNSVGYVKFRARNDKATDNASGYGHIISMFVKRGDVDTTISLESETNTHWQDVAGTGTCWSCTFDLTSSDCTIGTISYADENKVKASVGYSVSAKNAAQVTKYQDGWYRISFKFMVRTVPASNDPPTVLMRMTGNNGTSMFVFGPQVETAPSSAYAGYTNGPTSYIPFNETLGGTPNARSRDYCDLTADNFRSFNQSAGSFWIEMSPLPRCDVNTYPAFFNAGGVSIYIGILYGWFAAQYVPYIQSPNRADQIDADLSTPGQHRIAIAYEGSTYVGAIDGLVPSTMTTVTTAVLPSGTSSTTSNRFVIGGIGDATVPNTCIARIKYWPRRLDNSLYVIIMKSAKRPGKAGHSR